MSVYGKETNPEFKVKQILLLRRDGATIPDIVQATGLGMATVQKYTEMHQSEIEKMKDEQKSPPETENINIIFPNTHVQISPRRSFSRNCKVDFDNFTPHDRT
jgi:hypothetical protein